MMGFFISSEDFQTVLSGIIHQGFTAIQQGAITSKTGHVECGIQGELIIAPYILVQFEITAGTLAIY